MTQPAHSPTSGIPGTPFSSRQCAVLAGSGVARVWERGEELLRHGGPPDCAILIGEGLVKITAYADTGYEGLLALRGPGELVGELSCIDDKPRSATATAMRTVHGTVITAAAFRRLLARDGELSFAILRSVVGRLRDSDGMRLDQGAHPAGARIARVLLDLALRHGADVSDAPDARTVSVNQQELAGAAGTSRESVVRTLRVLQQDGLVSTSRGRTRINDMWRLGRWAGI
ncbi:Crp/Fnr family transcriptional regulator [Yinghuangia seranimata]|uniref:Crp/Fnr family transcriptional regulator n=1 Tax=Yinghuangia seranimata TaxID=408067 RepID=UPI00248CDBC0|nr:Crp/Fnr family transcriptional regulator [Yinghuangia seranimata]MDI2129831.1 Crp/Fnr family transcriptional regulator [Yinghuangia seranimata]